MLFISFVEILSIKAVEGFIGAGYSDAQAYIFANLMFFCGIGITMVLDFFVHTLMAGPVPGHDHGHELDHDHDVDFGARSPSSSAAARLDHEHPGGEPDVIDVESGAYTIFTIRNNPCAEGVGKASPPVETKPSPDKSHSMRSVPGGTSDQELKQMGLITGLAIALHNFPEGLATFVATLADARLGVAVAFAIALHNIPEGLCVAMPLYYSTGSRVQGFLWAFVSGLSEPLGGLIGYLILAGSDMHPLAYGIIFAIVAGMMVYISFQELLPTALKYDKANSVTVKSVFVGMAVMDLSIVLFQI
jgi:ZIP family zinc transporter